MLAAVRSRLALSDASLRQPLQIPSAHFFSITLLRFRDDQNDDQDLVKSATGGNIYKSKNRYVNLPKNSVKVKQNTSKNCRKILKFEYRRSANEPL